MKMRPPNATFESTRPRAARSAAAQRVKHAADVADYVAQMCAELATMAEAAELDLLGYLLNLARAEADEHARPPIPSANVVRLKG